MRKEQFELLMQFLNGMKKNVWNFMSKYIKLQEFVFLGEREIFHPLNKL